MAKVRKGRHTGVQPNGKLSGGKGAVGVRGWLMHGFADGAYYLSVGMPRSLNGTIDYMVVTFATKKERDNFLADGMIDGLEAES